jgi:hypothetical protein
METATVSRSKPALPACLAGLQAGLLGALCLLAWLGASAVWKGRSFWTAANLMASVFYGADAIRAGISGCTLFGVALYLLQYSLLGALFAMTLQTRMPRLRLTLVSILVAISWYYLSFGVVWRNAAPLLVRLHPVRATLWGHILYGAMLSRYPVYLAAPPAQETPESAAPQTVDALPASVETPSEEPPTPPLPPPR